VLTRRLNRWKAAQDLGEAPGKKPDLAFSILPDLLIVDGGKGQLGRAVAVLGRFDLLGKVPVAGLAKQQEEIFLPERSESILLPRNSQGLFLVQRVRDEAHRFANTAHRKLRTRTGLASRLDVVPGIGPRRRKALIQRFGSVADIKEASAEELSEVPGINLALALQSRGFAAKSRRTSRRVLHMRAHDWVFMLLVACAVLGLSQV
jgi:excinuclease ABC subunit C